MEGPPGAWKDLDGATTREMENSQGFVEERFALCQALPLERFPEISGRLGDSGYRPIRFRPYAAGGRLLAAAVWTRDGLDSITKHDLDAQELKKEIQRNKGFALVDLACYVIRGTRGDEDRYAATWKRSNEEHPRFEMFEAIPVSALPKKIREFKELNKQSLACSSLHGAVRADGRVCFCAIFDDLRAARPRRSSSVRPNAAMNWECPS